MSDDTLRAILEEQRKTNELLVLLIEAMADEQDEDAQPARYLDGTLAHG